MSKKIWFSILAVAVLSVISVTAAFASQPLPGRGTVGRRGIGEVVAITQGALTIQTRQDDQYMLKVDAATIFRGSDGSLIPMDDIQVGQWVAGVMTRDEAGEWTLRLVVQLPEGAENASGLIRRMAGVVTGVQPEANQFTLRSRLGVQERLTVDGGTRYLGQVGGLGDLQVGMGVLVGALRQEDGTWLAIAVGARQPVMRFGGEIVQVDLAAGTFNLALRGGETATFIVDDATRFRSPDGSIQNLGDLQPGMLALVRAQENADSAYQALAVGAATKEQLPRFDLRTGGKLTEVGLDSFTIQTRNGEQLTIQVTAETRFRSRGGFVQSLEDLKPGMLVLVGAHDLGSDDYLAQGVLVLRRLPLR
jgi:hypothetical protein